MAEASTKLGRVSLVPRGTYDATATYNRLDIVEYEGSSYLVLADGTTGVTPAAGTSYMLVAERGDTGDTGPIGTTGAPGPAGTDGEDGVGIQNITRTGGDGSPGTTDTYTITLTDGTTSTFTVYNGANGAQGPAGEEGTSFVIKGRYGTLDELMAAHPTGSEGEAWAVGSASDNDVYLWDVDQQMWTNIGGMQGPAGLQGPPGKDGAQGVQGPPGADGENGATFTPSVSEAGVLSWANDKGLPNPASVDIKGPPGQDGAQGAAGPAGADGTPGTDGKSAYQYAVDGGYTGTEEEFQALMGTGPWLPLSGGTLTGDLILSDKKLRLKYQNRIVTINPTNLASSGTNRFVLNIGEVLNSNYTQSIPIYGVGTPELKNEAANKKYVDDLVGDIASILDSINGEVA